MTVLVITEGLRVLKQNRRVPARFFDVPVYSLIFRFLVRPHMQYQCPGRVLSRRSRLSCH